MTTNFKDVLEQLSKWEPHFDEDGDLEIHSQEMFGAYMADHHETILLALKLADAVTGEPTEGMYQAVAEYLSSEYEKRCVIPGYGACACLGPLPMCPCARSDLKNKLKSMVSQLLKEIEQEG